jgi:hypothetical protein
MAYANVGAQDPELKNSPIAGEDDDEELDVAPFDEGAAKAVCYFNGETFAAGTVVRSGSLLLRCEFGVWVPIGGSDPDNP